MSHRVSVMIHVDHKGDVFAETDIPNLITDAVSIAAANLAYGLVEEAYNLLDDEEDAE